MNKSNQNTILRDKKKKEESSFFMDYEDMNNIQYKINFNTLTLIDSYKRHATFATYKVILN